MEDEKIIVKYNPHLMRKLLAYLKPYSVHTAVSLAALVAVTVSELLAPVIIQRSVDSNILSENPSLEGLAGNSLILLGLLGLGLLASFAQVYLMSAAAQGIMKTLRMELLTHTAGQSLSFFGKSPVGTLVTRATNDVETISEFFSSVVMTLIKNFVVMAGVIGVLFFLNVRLGALTVLTLPPVILITVFFRVKARDAYRRVRKRVSMLNAFLSERISGIRVVQSFAHEDFTDENFRKNNDRLLAANMGEMYVFAVFRPLISMLGTVSLAVIIYFGAGMHAKGILTLGVLIAYLDLVHKFYRPLQQLSEQFTVMQSAMAGAERIFELLETEDHIPDYSGKAPEGCPEPVSAEESRLTFNDVSFAYKEGEPVLKQVSFSAGHGETIAIVGYTGAGKSTIANLAARFWDVDSGCIKIDGEDIRKFPLKKLRQTVQAVAQDVFIFSGSIRDNITLGKDISDELLEKAAETACLKPVLEKLGYGFDFELTEGGSNLSAGQRQLIAFTRILAHDPPILILDEATASIDTETEKYIQKGLKNILENRTSIVIAHRLSTITDSDRIIVLSGGRIAESGTHDELLAAEGLYSNLYSLQFGE